VAVLVDKGVKAAGVIGLLFSFTEVKKLLLFSF